MISKSRHPSFTLIHGGAFHFHRGTSRREFSHSFSITPTPTKNFKCWFTLSRCIIYSFLHCKFLEKDENKPESFKFVTSTKSVTRARVNFPTGKKINLGRYSKENCPAVYVQHLRYMDSHEHSAITVATRKICNRVRINRVRAIRCATSTQNIRIIYVCTSCINTRANPATEVPRQSLAIRSFTFMKLKASDV